MALYDAAIKSLETNLTPLTLRAPMDGMVTYVNRQPSEYVAENEPLIGISPLWSEHAVGYLRQPYPVDPYVGMPVEIITRTRQRQKFTTHVIQVGGPLEYITNSLAQIRLDKQVDVGLPVVIGLPHQTKIRPGELMDVFVQSSSQLSMD
jgi:multidrug resistance efflux pump